MTVSGRSISHTRITRCNISQRQAQSGMDWRRATSSLRKACFCSCVWVSTLGSGVDGEALAEGLGGWLLSIIT